MRIFLLCLFFYPAAAMAGLGPLEEGKMLYETHCASCHGSKGDGKGPVAQFLWPKPRDFTTGVFKYRTTRGPIPSDLDLLQTMKVGIPGTSMPGWDMLEMKEWRSLLSYVKSFSPRLNLSKATPSVDIPTEPKSTPERIQEGHKLYKKSNCQVCHGLQGKGDGPGAKVLKDVWGNAITPRDLTQGPLKWGNSNKDIYRTLMLGVPGTPMPGFEQTFTKDQLWALVFYLKSIQKPMPEGYDPSNPKRNLITVSKIQGEIPLDYTDEAWEKIPEVPVFLKILWHERNQTEWLSAKALHNGQEIAFYLRWPDNQMDITQGQSDSVAIQFPGKGIDRPSQLPYLGMGSESNSVNIWQWKEGVFTDFNAKGIHTLKQQRKTHQNVSGKGVYYKGEWHVIFKRLLNSHDMWDAPFLKTGYLSFAIWDTDLPKHPGPEGFSEWMVYELR